jgi:hypothetical protein
MTDRDRGGDRHEYLAAGFSAKIQIWIFHGMIPFDWPRCGDDAPLDENLHG